MTIEKVKDAESVYYCDECGAEEVALWTVGQSFLCRECIEKLYELATK